MKAIIHPRFRDRIREVGASRSQEILDRQARIYRGLSKAAYRLRRSRDRETGRRMNGADYVGPEFDEKKAEAICTSTARAVHELAWAGSSSEKPLLAIYTDLQRLSESINRLLDGRNLSSGSGGPRPGAAKQ